MSKDYAKNQYHIKHNASTGTVIIFHNINSDVLAGKMQSLGLIEVRRAGNLKKGVEQLFKHLAKELEKQEIKCHLSIRDTERNISFAAKDAFNAVKAVENGLAASSRIDLHSDLDDQYAMLKALESGEKLDFAASKKLEDYTNDTESADPDDWKELHRDVLPLLKSIASSKKKSAPLVHSSESGFFSRLFCCCKPSQSSKSSMTEPLISATHGSQS